MSLSPPNNSRELSSSRTAVDDRDPFVFEGISRPASSGYKWIVSAWEIFKQSPFMWIALTFIAGIISIILSVIPYLNILNPLFTSLISAGFIYSAYKVDRGEELSVEFLLYPFQAKFIIAFFLINLPVIIFNFYFSDLVNYNSLRTINPNNITPENIEQIINLQKFSSFIIFIIPLVFYSILLYYVPAVIILQKLTPIRALKSTFSALIKNIPAGIINSLLIIILMLASVITLFLGLIVLIPVLGIMFYTFYKDVFLQKKEEIIYQSNNFV